MHSRSIQAPPAAAAPLLTLLMRANAFGYLVADFNAVHPLDRGDRGWRFVFNLRQDST